MSERESNRGDAAGEEVAGTSRERPLKNTSGLFPDDTLVAVRYPTGRADEQVWFTGTIVGQYGPDEWEVAVDDPRVASGREDMPLVRCRAERMRVLTPGEWRDLVNDAYRRWRRA